LREERRGRIALHLGALAALVLVLVLSVRLNGLPMPPTPEDLGLTGAGGEEGGAEERSTRKPRNEFDFKNEYSEERGRAPVAVVVLHDEYTPESGLYYFRQSALSRYNGRRLVRPTRDDVDRDIIASFPSAPRSLDWQPPVPEERRSVRTTTGVLIDHVRPFAIDTPVSIAPVGREDPRFRRVYESVSLVREGEIDALFGGAGGDSDWNIGQLEYYTRIPEDLRYREFAERMLDSLKPEYRDDPLARALAVKYYLDKNGIYSRRSQHADADDPVASFLFGDLTGYCVHFAHAAVYLMRSLGVPSRVATGYAVPAEDRGGGSSVMIRGLNGHAWPEIYLEGAGWVVVDLAPETVLDQFAAAPDGTLQMMLGQMLRDGTREVEYEKPPPPLDFDALARLLAAGVVLVLLSGFIVKAYRRFAPRFASKPQLARVAYRAALDHLVAVGVRRRYGEGRERFADRAAALAPSIDALTRTHLAAAWGGKRVRDRTAVVRRVTALADELRSSTPRWRRWLGALNPYSWLRVR
jgi:transglutaminase-like putative cysteine protease